jgi:methylated-DNA-protein-cysteine methyltransferase-like protein
LDFYHSVYEIVKRIPEGRVTTYGAIAKALGSAQSSRMVGWAMNASHSLENVPAHRVVNRKGLLTGKMHFTPPERMQTLLEAEGLTVINDQIVRFEKHFWDPFLEL